MKKFYKKKYRLVVPVVALAFGMSFAPTQVAVLENPLRTESWVLV